VKTNLARQFNQRFPELASSFKDRSLWSIGYYVGSVGKASKKAAQQYIDNQGPHHGVRDKEAIEIMRWVNPKPPNLRAAHATFDLSYHVVLVTTGRREVFDKDIAPEFFEALVKFSEDQGFYIERMSLLSDHMHLLVKLVPSMSIEACVLGLMNHSWQFMTERYYGVLKATGAYNVWTESFYVSTVGEATTAQIKSFLGRKQGTTG
jgi:putative transposase